MLPLLHCHVQGLLVPAASRQQPGGKQTSMGYVVASFVCMCVRIQSAATGMLPFTAHAVLKDCNVNHVYANHS
jgi:hypothetical protein